MGVPFVVKWVTGRLFSSASASAGWDLKGAQRQRRHRRRCQTFSIKPDMGVGFGL